MVNKFKDFLQKGDNLTLFIIIASFLVLLIIFLFILVIFHTKKKKYRKSLEELRSRIQKLKNHEVIKNYSSYDNLKSDQKLGMLVIRWKKEIEKLVKEVDAQYSMLDVLEDVINQNNYQYFISLKKSFYNDIEELETKADKLKDEIIEYIDMASDNRKYINKYYNMVAELKEKYANNKNDYEGNQDQVEEFFLEIDKKFAECKKNIEHSEFIEADNVASNIFKDIKILENYLENAPKILGQVRNVFIPKFNALKKLSENFSKEDFKIMNIDFSYQYEIFYENLEEIVQDVNEFKIADFEKQLKEINNFLVAYNGKLKTELDNKKYIIKNLEMLSENIKKLENTAKNFNSIFKTVEGSYNITEKEIKSVEQLLEKVVEIKERLGKVEDQFVTHDISYEEIKYQLDRSEKEITKISRELDENLIIIDEIYKDEKTAHEQICLLTEKLNGTKKYVKYANLENKEKYIEIIKTLNMEVSQLYMLLNSFPIDIVKLNEALQILVNKVDKTTQDINSIIYKTLLTEFVIVYANRFFSNKDYQKELLIAENLFYKKSYTKAYEKVIKVLEEIGQNNKHIVLEKYQNKFSELFK